MPAKAGIQRLEKSPDSGSRPLHGLGRIDGDGQAFDSIGGTGRGLRFWSVAT